MRLIITLVLFLSFTNVYSVDSFYDLKAKKIDGDTLNFSELKGKKLLIVNVASYCGYTYQYSELQSLYNQYGGDKFEIIGFPANNFSNQEPGTDSSIYDFCTDKYNVTFTMMSKISVVGNDKHPVYQWLTLKSKNGVADQEVLWNFQKYLVNEFGQLVGIHGSQTSPLTKDIVDWVKQGATSINEEPNRSIISPNPSSDFITIQASNAFETSDVSKVQIFDVLGIEIKDLTPALSEGDGVRIDVSHLPAGVYFIRIGNVVEKFVKM